MVKWSMAAFVMIAAAALATARPTFAPRLDGATAGEQDTPADGPLRVGTVNLEQCFDKEKYPYMKDVHAELEKLGADMAAEVKALKKHLSDLEEQINGLDSKTNLYQEKVRTYKLTEAKLDATAKFSKAQLRAKEIMMLNEVYTEIRRVVNLVAAEGKYDFVLRVEEPRFDEDSPDLGIQRINYRIVFYAGEKYDITRKVIERLGQEYAKRKAGGPPPPPPK
jgi:Skp family chaperone for outer membrane proteins